MDRDQAMEWLITLLHERAQRAIDQHPHHHDRDGLRERKKRQMRQLISDTATMLFLERGFDAVRVAEVADACGVSEKTVFNYFPTKESMVLDREAELSAEVRRAVAADGSGHSLVEQTVEVITESIRDLSAHLEEGHAGGHGVEQIRRFTEMVEGTPALHAAQRDLMDRLVQVAARALAERAGVDPEAPEPQIAARTLLSLWAVALQATRRHAGDHVTPAQFRDAVIAEVRRAGRLADTGLWCFNAIAQGGAQRASVREAAESVEEAGRQVVAAMRQARAAWRTVRAEAERRR